MLRTYSETSLHKNVVFPAGDAVAPYGDVRHERAPRMPPVVGASESFASLQQIIAMATQADALKLRLDTAQWKQFAAYLQPFSVETGQSVIVQGASDTSVYFVESGALHVHYASTSGKLRLALVGPGSVVGEGAFFSHAPRNATVAVASTSRLWMLNPMRYSELAHRNPALALSVVTALAGVLARRTGNRPRRAAVT